MQSNCLMGVGYAQGYASMSVNGQYGHFMCTNVLGSLNRVVVRVAPNGTVDYGVTLATSQTTYAPRAATSFDGVATWASDGRSLSYRATANGALAEMTTVCECQLMNND